jgi:hypothetical protein
MLGLVVACDSTETGGTQTGSQAGASTADIAAFCDATCTRDQRCPDPAITYPPYEQCKSSCIAKIGTNPVYRTDSFSALRECYTTLACAMSDDQCLMAAVNVVTATPENDPSYLSCVNRQDACAADGVSDFSDDLCVTQLILTAEAKARFANCLTQACEQMLTCYDNLTGSTG